MASLPGLYFELTVSAEMPLSAPMPPMPGMAGELVFSMEAPVTAEVSLSANFEISIEGQIVNAFQSARISALNQQLISENIVSLFTLDLSKFGIGIARFTTEITETGQPLKWGGELYYPAPVEATGFERRAGGSSPRPTLRLGNLNRAISGLLLEGDGDLVGCEVVRTRTYRRFLDDGLEPSTLDTFIPEIYRIERKSSQTATFVEFELASILDQEGVKLPKRQYLRDHCTFFYRKYIDGVGWRYDRFDPCPYTGSNYFDRNGRQVLDPKLDVCGKKVRDCKLRFGANNLLFTRAFPGINRVR